MEKLDYNNFDGHIILYCKNHYTSVTHNLIDDFKKIWAIRCGYEYNKNDSSMVRNIMDRLYKILLPTINNHEYFQQQLHDYLLTWIYKDKTLVEKIISFYCSEICHLQVRQEVNGKYEWLIKLPKPKKQVFNRILRGNGKYKDYELISN